MREDNVAVYFIGAGPGDPDLITVRGRELISRADLVLYAGSLVPKEVLAAARNDARVEDSAPLSLEETHALIMDTVRAGGLAVRVHTGESSLYGAVREQADFLRRDGVNYEIVPGVTAAFAAAARARIAFTAPEATQTLILTRMSGRTPVPEAESISRLAAHGSSMAVYLSADRAADLARELRQARTPEDTVIIIGVKVGHPGEKIIRTSLAGLEQAAREHALSRQTVFLILPGESAPSAASRLYAADFGHSFRKAVRPSTWPRMAVYAMTARGLDLARRIAEPDKADIFAPDRLGAERGFARLADQVRANFDQYHAHVFIAAAGIGGDGVADSGDPESVFPREMALRAAVVAMTNGVATDVFKDDGSTFNLSNFHSYSDLSGFHLLVVDEGSWSAKDERTWRVEGLKCSMSEGDKFLKASMDVTFDGANYVVLNVERTIAKEADLDSGDPAKVPVETLRFSSENPFLMVTPRLIEMGR